MPFNGAVNIPVEIFIALPILRIVVSNGMGPLVEYV